MTSISEHPAMPSSVAPFTACFTGRPYDEAIKNRPYPVCKPFSKGAILKKAQVTGQFSIPLILRLVKFFNNRGAAAGITALFRLYEEGYRPSPYR
jgi:hypothetical protein